MQEGEVQALDQEHQMLHHAKEYLQQSQHVTQLLTGEEGQNIYSSLNQVMQILNQLPAEQPYIKNTLELVNSALIQCEEAANEMEQFAEQISLDPQRLYEVEERISTIHSLARKYHIESTQLSAYTAELESQLEHLRNAENKISDLQGQLAKVSVLYQQASLSLRESRVKFAKKLAKEITNSIQQLGMPRAG